MARIISRVLPAIITFNYSWQVWHAADVSVPHISWALQSLIAALAIISGNEVTSGGTYQKKRTH